jgi:hypothetical protein
VTFSSYCLSGGGGDMDVDIDVNLRFSLTRCLWFFSSSFMSVRHLFVKPIPSPSIIVKWIS